MNKHTVFVAGKRFVLLSDDKESYVQKLASEVSAAINKIIEENPTLDRRSSAILCALDYADDKYKAMGKSKSISDKAQPIIAQADKQSKQIKELKDQLSQRDRMIDNNNEELKKLRAAEKDRSDEIKRLEDELKAVKAELEEAQNTLDEITKPEEALHIPEPKKYEKAEKKRNQVDKTEDDDIDSNQLFSLFD